MPFTTNDYKDALLNNGHKIFIAKIEILDYNENPLEEITDDIISGDITLINQKGSRRNANIVLYNGDNKYTPAVRNSLWLDKKIKIYTGIQVDGVDYLYNRGLFLISEVQTMSDFSSKTVNITCLDKMCFINGEISGTLTSPYIIPIGSDVLSVVQAILTAVSERQTPVLYQSATLTPYTITKDAGDTYADILEELSNLYSWDYYYDKNGSFHFEPPLAYNYVYPIWDFGDSEVTYLGGNHRYRFDSVKNSVYVWGNNVNGTQAKAAVADLWAFSPTRVTLIGERPLVITDDIISTDAEALDRAYYELSKSIILQETIDIQCIPIDIIDEDNIVTITDGSIGVDRSPYYVQQIQFPLLDSGNMTISCWKTRPIV